MNSKPGTLAIFSDCVHQYDKNGNVVTENHIFCRQMEALAEYYSHTEMYCPFIENIADTSAGIYTNSRIHFTPLPNAGGNRLSDKFKMIKILPVWFSAFSKAARNSDIVYQRFPNNLNLPGFFYFYFKKKKVFATYTGTWENYRNEPFTYRLQKWLLKHFFRGPAGVYLQNDAEQKNIVKTYSPSYTRQEWEEESEQVNMRVKKIKTDGISNPVFITVGSLVVNKNQQFILNAFKELKLQAFAFHLYIAGDGPLMHQYSEFINQNNLEQNISLTGRVGNSELRELYRKADFLIQAPLAEGYGKAAIEGFLHGVIPLLSDTALAKEMTGLKNERGYIFSTGNFNNIVHLIKNVTSNTQVLPEMINEGRKYVYTRTLEKWAKDYYDLVYNFYYLQNSASEQNQC